MTVPGARWSRAAAGAVLIAAATPAPLVAQDAKPRGRVVTDTVWSQALGASKSLVIYLPPSYGMSGARRYPVVYYLHGADGDETNWTQVGKLDQVMDSLVAAGKPEMIVAMPDGDNSWYATSNVLLDAAGCRRMLRASANPDHDCVAWPHYDDYVAYDLVRHVDAKYRTMAVRERRAIAGLSMGGYGAITLALQYPGTFAAAASHSGVLWPMEFGSVRTARAAVKRSPADSADAAGFGSRNAERFRVIFGADSAGWFARDPVTLINRRRASAREIPAIYADCGTGDLFLAQNRAFRDALAARGVPLEYREWPGSHDWAYWRAHVGESLSWIAAQIATPAPR